MSTDTSVVNILRRYRRKNPRLKWNLILDAVVTLALTITIVMVFGSFQAPHRNLLKSSGAVALTASELVNEVRAEKVVAYWLGPISGSKYTLVSTSKGQVIITYLSGGQGIDDAKQQNLQIETRVNFQSKGVLVAKANQFTNRNDLTSAGNTYSFDTSIMNFMSIAMRGSTHHIMVYYPTPRTFQTMEIDAESLIRIS